MEGREDPSQETHGSLIPKTLNHSWSILLHGSPDFNHWLVLHFCGPLLPWDPTVPIHAQPLDHKPGQCPAVNLAPWARMDYMCPWGSQLLTGLSWIWGQPTPPSVLQWPHSTGTRWAQGWRESVTAGCPGLLQSEPTLFKELPCSEMKRVYPEVIQHWLIMSTLRTETVRKHEREEETPSLGTLNPNSHQVTVSSGVSRHCTVPTSYYHLGPPSCTQKPKVVLQGARPQTLRF